MKRNMERSREEKKEIWKVSKIERMRTGKKGRHKQMQRKKVNKCNTEGGRLV